ncbi:MAG: nucleotidyltransferase domain-containing protein [Desulfobulbaceae bacterium]|nr:nucleotidyltransferase domain-containing protein [Desulfobulbaceae bacterium]
MKYTDFPGFVIEVLDELAHEEETQSIWLIGSRANDLERPDSDWDFIAFVSDKVTERRVRNKNVDIVRVDRDGYCLLEGQDLSMRNSFENWRWVETEPGLATYLVRKTPDVGEGEAFDMEDVEYLQLRSINVWQRNA